MLNLKPVLWLKMDDQSEYLHAHPALEAPHIHSLPPQSLHTAIETGGLSFTLGEPVQNGVAFTKNEQATDSNLTLRYGRLASDKEASR